MASVFSISPPFVQISMNVAATMEAVHTHAPTQLAHSSAAVELDTHWQRTERVAVVSRFIGCDTSRVVVSIYASSERKELGRREEGRGRRGK